MRSHRAPLAIPDAARRPLALAGCIAFAAWCLFGAGAQYGRDATLAAVQARAVAGWGGEAVDQGPAWAAGQDAPSSIQQATPEAVAPEAEPSRFRCADVPASVAPASVTRWCSEIDAAADTVGLDPRALAVLVRVECPQGDPACGSHAGAQGLAQIMAPTAATIAAETGLPCTAGPNGVNLDPAVNLACGAHYYAQGLRAAASIWRAGDEASHVGAAGIGYNSGNGNVPKVVAHWQAGGHVCDAPVPAESRRWCRMAHDSWQLMQASPAPLDATLGIAWRGRP